MNYSRILEIPTRSRVALSVHHSFPGLQAVRYPLHQFWLDPGRCRLQAQLLSHMRRHESPFSLGPRHRVLPRRHQVEVCRKFLDVKEEELEPAEKEQAIEGEKKGVAKLLAKLSRIFEQQPAKSSRNTTPLSNDFVGQPGTGKVATISETDCRTCRPSRDSS